VTAFQVLLRSKPTIEFEIGVYISVYTKQLFGDPPNRQRRVFARKALNISLFDCTERGGKEYVKIAA